MQTNEQLKLVADFIKYTNRNIFLTGKAGTGKTTFLKSIASITPKRTVVVAPTGVAAINAAGVTIHSFFQLPFTPFLPENSNAYDKPVPNKDKPAEAYQQKLNRKKINLIKGIDLLVIDEISMVRADLLDAIDETLRRYRDYTKPFGGVQLLMIGDLFQLAPVVKDEEWSILKQYYETMYFFSSKALQKTSMINIELKHIYRQSDNAFISILNKVRDNNLDEESLLKLNSRYQPDFNPDDKEGYIILTTHNATANNTNENKLHVLKGKSHYFKAQIKDEFPPYQFPTEETLELKLNAQVMFVKNDPDFDKKYYNGKIGKVSKITEDLITVDCEGDENSIEVGRLQWENIRYNLNEETKEVKEEIIGTFTQFPLKLAWAITIHKSQGLTFEHAIIDANLSFAHGQVYVALSRCKSFEGMVLRSKINAQSIKTDVSINSYTEEAKHTEPNQKTLEESKHSYQKSQMEDLFSFYKLNYRINHFYKILNENKNSINQQELQTFAEIQSSFTAQLFSVGEKFKQQIKQLAGTEILPEENQELQERIKKAASYFHEKIEEGILKYAFGFTVDIDNKAVKKQIFDSLEKLQLEIAIKVRALESAKKGFNSLNYIKEISNADIDFVPKIKKDINEESPVGKLGKMPKLYYDLKLWRHSKAIDFDVSEYMVLPQKTMISIVEKLPTTENELKKIKGLGKQRIKMFGIDILDLIEEFIQEQGLENKTPKLVENIEKVNTKQLSFDLFKSGKNIAQIAKQRDLTISTIEGHLAHFVSLGELDVKELLTNDKISEIRKVLEKFSELPLNEIKYKLGDNYSFSEIRFVKNSIK